MISSNKKIILVNVTEIVRDRKLDIVFPLGMLYLYGSLKNSGYNVKTYNISTKEIKNFINEITRQEVLFIGICSVLTGLKIDAAVKLSKAIKSVSDIPVVWGGLFPSSEPELCLQKDYIDLLGIGEGEELIVDIAKIYTGELRKENVYGVGFKDADGKIVINPRRPMLEDLDRFMPDISDVNVDDYVYNLDRNTKVLPYPIMTSRGCPYNCAFCYNSAYNMRRWRKYSVDYIVRFLKELKSRGNFEYIILADDNPFVDKQRFFLIMEKLFNEGVKISHFGLKLNKLEESDLKNFVQYQVRSIYYGIESFQDRVLKLCQKEHTRDLIHRAIKLIKNYPELPVVAGIVVGMPGETFEEMRRDIREALDNISFDGNMYIYVVILFPIPKTKFYNDLAQEGRYKVNSIEEWSKVSPYESERILKVMRPEATKRDLKMVIMAKRYTEKIINAARKVSPKGEKRKFYIFLYSIINRIRYVFFALGKWRLYNEKFFLSGLDFFGIKVLFFIEKIGKRILL